MKKLIFIFLVASLMLASFVFADEIELEIKMPFGTTKQVVEDIDGNYITIEILEGNRVLIKTSSGEQIYMLPDDYKRQMPGDIKNHWAEADIEKLINRGLIMGYPDGTFKPNNTITRAEFGAILSRILERSLNLELPVGYNAFSDVAKEAWYFSNLSKLQYKGNLDAAIYNGTLNPNSPITREEMALWLARDILEPGQELDFKDKGSIKYQDEVKKIVGAGLLQGYPDGTFKAKGNTTRAEASAFFVRYMTLRGLID